SLKVDQWKDARIEPFCDKLLKGGARLDVDRHARIVTPAKSRPPAGLLVRIIDSKLARVALVVIVGKAQPRMFECRDGLSQEQAAVHRSYDKHERVRVDEVVRKPE